jgi:hypothetical protein
MSRLYRGFAIGIAAVQLATAGGCAFGRKPYSNDPLLKADRAVWGNRDRARLVEEAPPEPIAPPPPAEPLIGGRLAAVPTSP